MFGTLGGPELFLIFVVALIVFGPRKLPDIGKSFGRMMAEFRRASNDFRSTIESEVESEKIRESMRIEPPRVEKVKEAAPTAPEGGGPEAVGGPAGATETAGDPDDLGASMIGKPAETGSAGTPAPATGSDGQPSTVSHQPPPPATEPK